jgi:hypothetical protein
VSVTLESKISIVVANEIESGNTKTQLLSATNRTKCACAQEDDVSDWSDVSIAESTETQHTLYHIHDRRLFYIERQILTHRV